MVKGPVTKFSAGARRVGFSFSARRLEHAGVRRALPDNAARVHRRRHEPRENREHVHRRLHLRQPVPAKRGVLLGRMQLLENKYDIVDEASGAVTMRPVANAPPPFPGIIATLSTASASSRDSQHASATAVSLSFP